MKNTAEWPSNGTTEDKKIDQTSEKPNKGLDRRKTSALILGIVLANLGIQMFFTREKVRNTLAPTGIVDCSEPHKSGCYMVIDGIRYFCMANITKTTEMDGSISGVTGKNKKIIDATMMCLEP